MNKKLSKSSNLTFIELEKKVRELLSLNGFGIITEIDLKQTMKAKLNKDYINHKILGACNPELAYEALKINNQISLVMPCNIIIVENEDMTSTVTVMKADELLSMVSNDNFIEISNKVDHIMNDVFDKL